MQTNCGHIFCNDCLKEAMGSGEKALCPDDGEKIEQVARHEQSVINGIPKLLPVIDVS